LRTKKRTAATSRTAATTTGMMMSIEAPREFDEEPLAGQVGTLQYAQLVSETHLPNAKRPDYNPLSLVPPLLERSV
jgi:hypothetical protein